MKIRFRRVVRHWAFWPLLLALALRLTAIAWGLPASDGWDNDGIAPRDVYPGLVTSFTPGEYYTYPPLHLAVLGVLSAPVAAVGALRAPSLQAHDVVRTMLDPAYMTWLAMIARVVALGLSLATTWLVADVARRTCGPRAALFTAWAGAVNLGFTYYGKTSNLDAPCVFWAALAVWLLARDQLAPRTRDKVLAALAAVCAVTTKDQAYANFVLVLPVCLAVSLLRTRRIGPWLQALAAGLGGFAVASTALFNPTGYLARIAFLRGSASQDFVLYSADWNGRLAALTGSLGSVRNLLGAPLLGLAAIGLVAVVVQRASTGRRVARLLPGLAALSFFLFFNCVARRGEERFVLAQSAFLAFYVGLGVAWLDARLSGQLALPVRFVVPILFVPALYRSVSLDAGLLQDPRYDVERWLAAHERPGDVTETYGLNVYLPRFPEGAVRVSPPEAPAHNPVPGLREVTAPFSAIEERKPRFVVVPHAYAWRYRNGGGIDLSVAGHVRSPTALRFAESDDATAYFQGLFDGRLAYRTVLDARCDETYFARIVLHASVCEQVTIFERLPAP